VASTITQYVQTDPEAGRRDANALAELIISDSLAPVEATDKAGDAGTGKGCASSSRQQTAPKALFLFGRAGQDVAGQPQLVQQGPGAARKSTWLRAEGPGAPGIMAGTGPADRGHSVVYGPTSRSMGRHPCG
jgi:hypothetical protein